MLIPIKWENNDIFPLVMQFFILIHMLIYVFYIANGYFILRVRTAEKKAYLTFNFKSSTQLVNSVID